MIIVLASGHDPTAETFVEQHGDQGVCMMTPADLSCVGWRHHLGDVENGTAVAAGRELSLRSITGVLTRLPWIAEYDLPHIVRGDRAYVATEMSAFLLSWLSELKCPVLNRPTPQCLSGPFWTHEKWVHTADRLGIPVTAVQRDIRLFGAACPTADGDPGGATVTIVGHRNVGTVDQDLTQQARALADAAGVDLLAVRFSRATRGAAFLDAKLWPDLVDGEVAHAVLEYFSGSSTGADSDVEGLGDSSLGNS